MPKTKDLMLDVARQLFARFGVSKTTMNDIADAAHKGRRTIYTYFKSKDEILEAVIERELQELYRQLEEVHRRPIRADRKLMLFIYRHLDTMKGAVMRNGSLRADFFKDVWMVERVRKTLDRSEQQLICEILEQGIADGIFVMPDPATMSLLILNSVKGLEIPFISGHLRNVGSTEFDRLYANAYHLIFKGISTQTDDALYKLSTDEEHLKDYQESL